MSDGAAAVVLRAEPAPVRIAGIGQGMEFHRIRYRSDLTSFRATQVAAEAAYRWRVRPQQWTSRAHDAFTPVRALSSRTRARAAGQVGRAILDGDGIGGRPREPVAGSSAGHPLAATGVSQLVELSGSSAASPKGVRSTRASGWPSRSAASPP